MAGFALRVWEFGGFGGVAGAFFLCRLVSKSFIAPNLRY